MLSFGLWLNFQGSDEEIQAQDAAQSISVRQNVQDETDSKTELEEKRASEEEAENLPVTYLIKEVDGAVKVFICDDEGNEELYLITSIPYDLLSESDQQLFTEGVRLDTEEDLGKFLESFDS